MSLIIVNHGTAGEVAKLLDSLRNFPQGCDYETIVVNTISEGAFQSGSGEVIDLPENRGFGFAVNRGIGKASGRYLMPMNSDLEFAEENVLRELVSFLDQNPKAGIIAPELINPGGSLQYGARTFYDLITIICRRTPVGKLLPKVSARHLMTDQDRSKPFAADWVMGAALLARRELLFEGKLFDEGYFLYFEDVDLCCRSRLEGYGVFCHPLAQITHNHRRESAEKTFSQRTLIHLKSMARFWKKHGCLKPAIE